MVNTSNELDNMTINIINIEDELMTIKIQNTSPNTINGDKVYLYLIEKPGNNIYEYVYGCISNDNIEDINWKVPIRYDNKYCMRDILLEPYTEAIIQIKFTEYLSKLLNEAKETILKSDFS